MKRAVLYILSVLFLLSFKIAEGQVLKKGLILKSIVPTVQLKPLNKNKSYYFKLIMTQLDNYVLINKRKYYSHWVEGIIKIEKGLTICLNDIENKSMLNIYIESNNNEVKKDTIWIKRAIRINTDYSDTVILKKVTKEVSFKSNETIDYYSKKIKIIRIDEFIVDKNFSKGFAILAFADGTIAATYNYECNFLNNLDHKDDENAWNFNGDKRLLDFLKKSKPKFHYMGKLISQSL